MSKNNLRYCQIFTLKPQGEIVLGGKARIVEGNFDSFCAVGNVRLDRNCYSEEFENFYFKELFVFDYDWARKWDRIMYGKTDGYKTGIYFPVDEPYAAALIIDDELQCCELVEVGKGVTKEVNGLTRHYNFDGFSLSIVTTAV